MLGPLLVHPSWIFPSFLISLTMRSARALSCPAQIPISVIFSITLAAAIGFVLPYHIGSVVGAVLIAGVVLLQKTNWLIRHRLKEPKEVFRI